MSSKSCTFIKCSHLNVIKWHLNVTYINWLYKPEYISSRPEKIVRTQNKIDSAFCDVNIKKIISEPVLGIGHRKTKLGISVLSNFILKYIGNGKSLCHMLAFLYSKCHNYVPPNWSLFSLANRVVMR